MESKDEVNGFHANGSVMDGDSLDSLSEQLESASLDATELDSETATSDLLDATGIWVIWEPQRCVLLCSSVRQNINKSIGRVTDAQRVCMPVTL